MDTQRSPQLPEGPPANLAKTPITAIRFRGYDTVAENEAPTTAVKSNAASLIRSLNNRSYRPEQFSAECFGQKAAQVAVAAPRAQVTFLSAIVSIIHYDWPKLIQFGLAASQSPKQ